MSDTPAADTEALPPAKRTLKERLTAQFNEYGKIAIITYFTISILAIVGFSIAIGIGYQPSTATGVFGVIFAGWIAAKATLPIRLVITLAITPVVAVAVNRFFPKRPDPDALLADPTAPDDGAAKPDDQ